MTPEEFESQTRSVLEQTLDQLQSAALMVAQLERQIAESGQTVQRLSQLVETYLATQKQPPHGEAEPS